MVIAQASPFIKSFLFPSNRALYSTLPLHLIASKLESKDLLLSLN